MSAYRKVALLLSVLATLLAPVLASAQTSPDILYLLGGHTVTSPGVEAIVVAPNSQYFASAGDDGTVKLWSLPDGNLLRSFAGHSNAVTAVAFSPDSQTLASASSDGSVLLWSVADGSLLRDIVLGSPLSSVAISKNNATLAVGAGTNVYVYSLPFGLYKSTLLGHTNTVSSVAFSPTDANKLASGSNDNTVRVWNVSARTSTVLSGHTDLVTSVAFSPTDANALASGSRDATVRLWSISARTAKVLSGNNSLVHGISFAPNGKSLASAGEDTTIHVWSIPTGTLQNAFVAGGRISSLAFAPDSQSVLSYSPGGGILTLWQVSDGTPLQYFGTYYNSVGAISISHSGQEMMTVSAVLMQRQVVSTGQVIDAFLCGVPLAYSSDDKLFLYTTYNTNSTSVTLRRVNTGQVLRTIPLSEYCYGAAFRPGNTTFVTYSSSATIKVWRVSDGLQLNTFFTSGITGGMAFSPDGSLFAKSIPQGIEIYKTSDGSLSTTLKDTTLTAYLNNVVWSADQKTVAGVSAVDGGIRIWNVPTGLLITTIPVTPGVVYTNLALTPLGDAVAASRNDVTLDVFGIYSGDLAYYDGEMGTGVTCLAYTPDSSLLMIGRNDSTLVAAYNVFNALASITVNPGVALGGLQTVTGTVSLDLPAPPGGATVSLSTNDPTDISLPSSVTVPAGQTSTNFDIGTHAVTAIKTIAIAGYYDGVTRTATLTVEPATPVKSVAFTPTSVVGGYSSVCVVTLSAKAPTGGLTVTLSSSDPAVIVPATIKVPSGKTNVQFLALTYAVPAKRVVTVSATRAGVIQSANLTVLPIGVSSLTLVPNSITGGNDAIGVVTLNGVTNVDTVVVLTSNKATTAAPEIKNLHIPAGQLQGMFYINSNLVTANTTVTITATKNTKATATLTVTP